MAVVRSKEPDRSLVLRRHHIVWLSFLVATTAVTALLALGDERVQWGFLATNTSLLDAPPDVDPIFRLHAPLDRQRWTGIVIHHSGEPAGDAQLIHRLHLGLGYHGLGHHFLIGNGNGLGDGVVHVGYRWNEQLPGAHTAGPRGDYHNQHSVGICLIGNGDRRPFTERQMTQLISLVRRLQRQLDIPAGAVSLHREVAAGVRSPGRFFPAAAFEEQLVTGPR